MHDANQKIDLQITQPVGGSAPRRVNVRITDHTSGVGIVDFDLTAEQFVAALGASHISEISAWVLPEMHRWKIGRRGEHDSVTLPANLQEVMRPYRKSVYGLNDRLPESMNTWIGQQMIGYHEWRLTHHNYGWALHRTCYVDVAEEAGSSD